MRVGLTGGVASGKSTVVGDAARPGCCRGGCGRARPRGRRARDAGAGRGRGRVRAGGADRRRRARPGRARGALVFADPARRAALEAIVHPLVRARAAEIEEAAPPGVLVVHDIPLLVETGQAASLRRGRGGRRTGRGPGRARGARTRLVARTRPAPGSRPRPRGASGWRRRPTSSTTPGRLEDLRQRVAEVFGELVGTVS